MRFEVVDHRIPKGDRGGLHVAQWHKAAANQIQDKTRRSVVKSETLGQVSDCV